jgi:hypothetical protein
VFPGSNAGIDIAGKLLCCRRLVNDFAEYVGLKTCPLTARRVKTLANCGKPIEVYAMFWLVRAFSQPAGLHANHWHNHTILRINIRFRINAHSNQVFCYF